jgi:16S rRNA (guanine1207-N2)-methyltransferase
MEDFSMTDYYFTENPNAEHDEKHWSYELLGHKLNFISDRGVFSKNTIDFGTRTLLEAIQIAGSAEKILDVGCGYGPIGISLAKSFPEIQVQMTEVNERALGLAKRHAVANSVENRLKFINQMHMRISMIRISPRLFLIHQSVQENR